ncbi:membrane fusion protein, multidrug efflux system [Halopseudomonas sabulinigri]|uniref:Membrane fusion protein, multidrug efflux system n=2 Tax=Halopseudomonas sabulinigri TaxID=472181 RepID=A0A1H1LJ83_9GAMM|nr:membrane fusion protein, multidrug efflux system [Halopseudomonas sabulinigri]
MGSSMFSKNKNNLVALLFGFFSPLAVAQVARLPVIVAAVEERTLNSDIQALGTLQANESAQLTSPISATISRIHFDDGQRVAAGEVLVELTNREQVAELEEARVALDDARRQLQRTRQLVDNKFVSAQELDGRQREFEVAQARLGAVEARLADRLIKAPFAGVLGLRQISIGTLLSPGMPVATLLDDSVMKLDFSIPETRMAQLRPGLGIIAVASAFPERSFIGSIVSLDNRVDPITRAIRVRAELDNEERLLRAGMLMSVSVASAPRQTLVIPEEALLPLGDKQFVMRIEGSSGALHAQSVRVAIGERLPGLVEITSGLALGERVVTHGGFRLVSGQPVLIKAEVAAGESVRPALNAAATP